MTAIIPNLFAQWTVTWTVAGVPRPQQTTLGLQPGVGLTPNQINVAMRTAWMGTAAVPFAQANTDNDFTLVETKVLYRNASGILLSDVITSSTTGSKTINALPINTSVIVAKNTAFAGKKYRGRFLIPPMYFDESVVDSGGNIAGFATYQGMFTQALTNMTGASINPVLLHDDPATVPTLITSFTVRGRIGTIGKRLRP